MKRASGIWLHVLFWTVYFGVNLFNELYLSYSFNTHPSSELLFNSIIAQLLVLSVKIPAVYYVLYSLIPRWLRSPSRLRLASEFVLIFLLILVCYRCMVQLVIWPYVYKEEAVSLRLLQYIARSFYSLLDLLQVVGIAAAIKLFRLRLAAMKNEKLLMQEKLQSEMQHLRSQINPHFLFNTLNSIYALARTRSADTPDAVMRLSKILRYMLYETEKKTITIHDELKIIADYAELQQMRFGSKVQLIVEKNIDNASAAITPLIILPLVENAFKHGTTGISGVAQISLRVSLVQDQLSVSMQNPLGDISVKNDEGEGIGLANMRRRLELLYRDHRFDYGKKEGNFVVALNINLNSYAGFELLDSGR